MQNTCPFLSTIDEKVKCFNTCPFNKENEECPFKMYNENGYLQMDLNSK